MTETVYCHDNDRDLIERVYRKAEQRQRDANREQGRQRLRDKIGFTERPPQNFRERCRGIVEEQEREPTFIDALRARRKEREAARRVRHG